jgi:mannose-binding lectin 1
MVNDGSWNFNADDDGGSRSLASCKQFIRNSPSALKIQYYDGKVSVFVKVGKTDNWRSCARAQVDLPAGYHFAVTAATGGLADNHDVTSLTTKRLVSSAQQRGEERPAKEKNRNPTRETDEQNKAKELADKLSRKKQNNEPTEAQPVQPQNPLPNPPTPRAIPPSDGTLQGEVRRLNEQYQNLGNNLEYFKQQVLALQAKENQDAQSLQKMVDQQAVFLEALEHMKKNPPGGLNDVGMNQRLSEFRRQTDQIREAITGKFDQKAVEINNLISELQRSLNIVKGTAAQARQDQENIQRDLAKQQRDLTEHVETSSGFGMWSYILVIQLIGGFGYMYYRKIRDDRNKKFY